jgi:hypothetical protein
VSLQSYYYQADLTYRVLIPNALSGYGIKLFGYYCDYPTPAQRAACFAMYTRDIGDSVLDAAKSHLDWIQVNRADACFEDAYSADRAAVTAYVKAAKGLLSTLGPDGTHQDGMAVWDEWIDKANDRRAQFLDRFGGFFSDCI